MDSCIDALATYLDDRSASSVSSDASSSSLNAQRLEDSDEVALRQQGDDWLVAVSHPVERVWAELNHYLELDFDQEGERDLLASDPDNRSFTVEYMTEKERNRNPFRLCLARMYVACLKKYVWSFNLMAMVRFCEQLTQATARSVKTINASFLSV